MKKKMDGVMAGYEDTSVLDYLDLIFIQYISLCI